MSTTLRLSAWLVVLGQCVTLIAAPIAVCCFASPGEMAAHECPHEMTTGAVCPMHAAPGHSPAPSDGDRWRDCGSDTDLLSWLNVPVSPPEAMHPGYAVLDSQPTVSIPLPPPLDRVYAPTPPPPRA